jgi:hypothetical protein
MICDTEDKIPVRNVLIRIKGLYMFQALLAHPQEVLHKYHLVYCVCFTSVPGLHEVKLRFHFNTGTDAAPPEQVALETCRDP